jgi:hypothetical protein
MFMSLEKITKEQMAEAINNSGYLIEQRVEDILVKKGYSVETNDAYLDPETGKSREIDLTGITGIKIFEDQDHFIFPYLLVECENNHQPVAFFRNNPRPGIFSVEEIKISGLPLDLYENDGSEMGALPLILKFDYCHHYCVGPYYTQYCTFQLNNKDNKKRWIASHSETQHGTFSSLIKCLDHKISTHHAGYFLPSEDQKERLNLQFYYPLIVLQGDLYEAYELDGVLQLEEKDHIQFRKQLVKTDDSESYQIDVIREKYLPTYLEIINQETNKIAEKLRSNWEVLERSIAIYVERAKKEEEVRMIYGKGQI